MAVEPSVNRDNAANAPATAGTLGPDEKVRPTATVMTNVYTEWYSGAGTPDVNKFKALIDNQNGISNTNKTILQGANLTEYSWNLPPHIWSLPVEPRTVDPMVVNTQNFDYHSSPQMRRGRIYYYSRAESSYTNNPKGEDPRYGFQFIWNPESFSTSVSVNMDITPTSADKFASTVGAFPSGEQLAVNLTLDRTNDFFCIRSLNRSQQEQKYSDLKDLSQYYLSNATFESNFKNSVQDKIKELQTRGTISDIEYLYKAINGPGWKSAATGVETSDIGFLRPTLLRIDIGPVSYIGYVTTMSVNHVSFTKSMIPMRSTVAIQFNLMATAGLASGGKVVSN